MSNLINTNTEETPPVGTSTDETSTLKVNYPDNFSSEFHGNPTIMKFVDRETGDINMANALTSLVHAQKMIGADKVTIPTKDAPAEDWSQVFRKLGNPENFEDYKIDVEGFDLNDPISKGFAEKAHQLGVLPKQAAEIVSYFNEATKAQNEQFKQEDDANYNTKVEALKTQWGQDFEKNAQIAEQSFQKLFDADVQKEMDDSGMLANPTVIKMLHSLGSKLMDDSTLQGTTAGANGFSNADEIVSEYRQTMDRMKTDKSPAMQKKLEYLLTQASTKGIRLY